jgi:hypothetical protein
MTTTQTGGGNGAAPDGGSGCKLPTRPGAWYGQLSEGSEPEIMRIGQDMRVRVEGWHSVLSVGDPRIRWLAPIPGPEVLAALAEWFTARELDCTESGHQDEFWDAENALTDAIRAERDGAA